MKKIYIKNLLLSIFIVLGISSAFAQQVPNPGFEDWSGPKFDDKIQPKDWYASNVEQVGFKFNFANQAAGHTGSYSMMVQDKEIGASALGITETAPGYFSLGKPWAYLEGLSTGTATAGTEGGISFKYRPDSMSVWIKRTGNNTADEDFYLLYYSWSGTAKGSTYKNKNGGCTSTSRTNEESDIRQALDSNECKTEQFAKQIAEGMWRERKTYGEWTNIRVPIYYFNNDVPQMMNIIFSAGNYPNFRANDGLYNGNSLYVDDVELIYSSKIHKLYVGGKEWRGFDPNSTEEQIYSLGRSATTIPAIKAARGAGELTNARGKTVTFPGRELTGSEISITNGEIDGTPTTITVKSEDGKSTTSYKIKFVREASTNAKLASISVNGKAISNFQAALTTYTYELPYGTTEAPVVTALGQEDEQTIEITQASSVTGTATIKVTAADKKNSSQYTIHFSVAKLSDNTLKDIKVNGTSIVGFTPGQSLYRVSLPITTSSIPTVEAVSAYPKGEQTITHTAPTDVTKLDGSTHSISVSTPGNPTPKTYKLTYKLEASSYSKLKSLQMGEGLITDFDPDKTTYYVNLPIGTTELPAITYEKGESTQKVTVKEGGINGTTTVTVLAGNSVDQTEYKIVVSTAKSEISSLNMIYVGGAALEGFSPIVTSYTYTLPIGTTELPAITYEKGDEYQKVVVTPGGINGTTRIVVTAENGNSTIYEIKFSVFKATDATLKMIYLDGQPLEGFDPNTLEYNCSLPQGTTELPVITYDQADEYQTVTVRSGGVNGDYRITVRPQSGASQTYILHFSVKTSDNASLKMIYLDGVALEGFHPDTLNYVDTLPMGVYTIPTVTFDKGEESQKVLNVCSGNVQTIKVTAESGKIQTYTIDFIIQRSNSAFLKMIYLDGDSLVGFDKNTFEYTVSLTGATSPKISVDKEDGQQVVISAPYATGQAKIEVRPESGASNTYLINFVNISSNTALLKNIYVDGVSVAGFAPEVFEYNVTTATATPAITYDAEAGQEVTVFRRKGIVTIYVESGSDKAEYTLNISTTANNDCTLSDITVDGSTIAGFAATTYNYSISLKKGDTPVFGYEKKYAEQTVYSGMLDANTYSMLVRAQSGDTARYIIELEQTLSSDANLENLSVEGHSIAFEPSTYSYTINLSAGVKLPGLMIVSKEGQSTEVHNVSDNEQQVIVIAEDGTKNIYTIHYNRNASNDALLKDILVNRVSLKGFEANTFAYTDTLAWRTRVVPCVQPIGAHPDQEITTYHSAVNGVTTIHVVAADGVTTKDYEIHFPVVKSGNLALEYIEIDHDSVSINYQPHITEYTIQLPYGETTAPLVLYNASEPEQTIEYISRPFGQVSEIKVIAENGDERTYKLHFIPTYASQANLLKTLSIVETGNPLDVTATSHTVALPYGTRTMTVNFTKTFAEQTVWVQPGGVTGPTTITVKSNRPGEEDVVYTLTPQVETQDPAVLTDIQVNGVTIEGFDPNRFSYIANIIQKPVITYTYAEGAKVTIPIYTNNHWQAQVTYQGRTNTYDVWYYYQNDKIPNAEFTEWTKCTTYTSADKPTGWNTIADVLGKHSGFGSFTPDGMVSKSGSDAVLLKSPYSYPGGGQIPGFITLGTVSGKWGVAGNSKFSISGGIPFHNTPDQLSIKYYCKSVNENNLITYSITGSDGNITYDWTNNETSSNYNEITYNLSDAYAVTGDPSSLNITLCSYNGIDGTIASTTAEMYVDWLHFTYNSTLTGLTVNDSIASKDGNHFTYTLPDSEDVLLPTLSFIGEVADQAQKVVWSDEAKEDGFGVRNATITNYAEDGTYTEYTLQLKRPLNIINTLEDLKVNGLSIGGFAPNKTEYVYPLTAQQTLPDLQPLAGSSLQSIATSYADSVMTIVVTPEMGEATTYTVRFVTELSDDVELSSITVVGGSGISFDPTQKEYTITADQMPNITFVKKMDGQTVDVKDGVLSVTAENGRTKGTYTIILEKPVVNTTGQLNMIEISGLDMQGFNSSTYEYTAAKPELVSFKRKHESDSVVFVQTPLYMEWQVYGTENHSYRITYPNELSSNTYLKAIYMDSTLYEAFNEQVYEYIYKTDEPVHVHAIANDKASALAVTHTTQGDTTIYTYTVTAEDGTVGNPYKLMVVPNLSNTSFLKSISLNGTPISDFRADSLTYKIVIPVGAYKTVEPTIPCIEYQLGAARQQVNIEHGNLNESTQIVVTSEDGTTTSVYELQIEAEASHCVSLSGIAVNGKPIEHFESQRHYYSVKCNDDNVEVTWSSNDNFQTVTETFDGYTHTLHVVAQDGISTTDYFIEVYKETASSDVTLKNILLDGMTLDSFETGINDELEFSAMQQRYNINLPSGTLVLPEISVLLNSDGQKVDISITKWKAEITVTAPDGISKNTYTLRFFVPKSNNSLLKMIYLDGTPMEFFDPSTYKYDILLPTGQTAMPDVYAEPQEASQTVLDSITSSLQHTIYVTAEDGTQNQYYLTFLLNPSQVDTLAAIYGDGELIEGFKGGLFYYTYTLPVGTEYIPVLTWDPADIWQTVTTDTVLSTPIKQITQIHVVAGSGKKNTYTVAYEIALSHVDTLQQIYVGADSLESYNAHTTEYYVYLAAGDSTAPAITWLEGDSYQSISSVTEAHIINGEQIGWKIIVTVVAQDGHSRIYTLYFMFTKVLSSNTELLNIYLNGEPMEKFNPSTHTYRIQVPYGETKPSVLATAAEPMQTISYVHGDTTLITVTAEDKVTTDTYTLIFIYQQSSYAYLEGIYQDGALIEGFRADSLEYHISLPYGTTELPTFTYKTGIAGQTVNIDTIISTNADGQEITYYSFIVTAPDEETATQYDVFVSVAFNDDCSLQSLLINGVEIDGFHTDTTEYLVVYPIGTDSTALFTKEAILPITNDSLASYMIVEDGYDYSIVVTAQDKKSIRVYTIKQIITLSSNTRLKSIHIGGALLQDFDADILEYTYYVGDLLPQVEAIAEDSTALVEYSMYSLEEPFYIFVTAQDGSEQIYTIYFEKSTINSNQTPGENDVLVKHLGGLDFGVATLRKNVSIGVYSLDGHILYLGNVPESTQNEAIIGTNAKGEDCLLDVTHTKTQFTLPATNQIYFYVFFESDQNRIKSGKLMVTP